MLPQLNLIGRFTEKSGFEPNEKYWQMAEKIDAGDAVPVSKYKIRACSNQALPAKGCGTFKNPMQLSELRQTASYGQT